MIFRRVGTFSVFGFAMLVMLTLSGSSEANARCTVDDEVYARSLGGHYVPEEAFTFGNLIRRHVSNRDIEGLFSLFEGELAYGPLRAFAFSRPFHSSFSQTWIDSVSKSSPPCYPEGKHFMLGDRGEVWFNKINSKWMIVSINLASKSAYLDRQRLFQKESPKRDESIGVGWMVEDVILPPQCFIHQWASSENFEELAERFDVSEYNIFNFPGELFGREIKNYQPFVPKWCGWGKGYCHQGEETWSGKAKLSLHQPLSSCITEETLVGILNKDHNHGVIRNAIDAREYQYSLLREVAPEACRALAPSLQSECIMSYTVEIGERTEKSVRWDYDYGVYGLFDLAEIGLSIVPLKFFPRLRDAMGVLK